ncbi:alpha/beta hydrolase-fold protein [Hanstruepera marina]|uniref:alpha/beta hydrolase-fold protein n=1 Tax=Hanstruepera marina TaxID=2873265 RepID=UPI001CA63819|nr:alpha/beta hydrolase-fold protein [Hanstruepera marina]
MKSRLSIALLFLFFVPFTFAQHIDYGKINIGTIDTISSQILNEDRRLWVHVPNTEPNSGERFPVVYLLDGSAHFPSVVGIIRQLSSINGNTLMPKMIVVGIPNTNRMRDLTPVTDGNIGALNTTGGGEDFIKFISDELMPYIDDTYPTTPYRLFIGHSLGGLTVLNTLLNHPDLFNAYIAIDPSLWWANSDLLNKSKILLNRNDYSAETVFVGVANTMSPGMDVKTVMQDTSGTTQHIRDILEFSTQVVPNSSSKLAFDYKYYNDDSHGSVPLISTYDGLRYIFSWYDMGEIIPRIMEDDITTERIIAAFENHYAKASQKMGYTLLPPENVINQLGYAFLRQNMNDKSEAFFKLNVKNYPNSSNVYDSLGDYYTAVNLTDKAIEAYEKAMSTNGGNGYSQAKLDALKAGN